MHYIIHNRIYSRIKAYKGLSFKTGLSYRLGKRGYEGGGIQLKVE
jgi:hypothetical protein